MIDITNVVASQRVLAHLDEGRLVRGRWHVTRGGRELACILGAIDQTIEDPSHCPATVMPDWLARETVTLFDRQPEACAMTWALRYAGQMARWHVLDEGAWERVRAGLDIATTAYRSSFGASAYCSGSGARFLATQLCDLIDGEIALAEIAALASAQTTGGAN